MSDFNTLRAFYTLSCALVIVAAGCRNSVTGPSTSDGDPVGRAVFQESGWSRPEILPVSDRGWEDSPYVTRDGRHVMFFYHPAPDILTDEEEALRIQLDGRIYVSETPFVSKTLHPVSTPDAVSEAGPYVSQAGEFFYFRTFPFSTRPNRIVRSGQLLDLGTGQREQNPHYCDAAEELYFDINDDDIYVSRRGATSALPAPINVPGRRDFQPFLTDDCQTMYFTSNRGSAGLFPMQVYRSRRVSGSVWREPELFISHPDAVGEFSMTADGRMAVFIELTRVPGGARNDIYFSRR